MNKLFFKKNLLKHFVKLSAFFGLIITLQVSPSMALDPVSDTAQAVVSAAADSAILKEIRDLVSQIKDMTTYIAENYLGINLRDKSAVTPATFNLDQTKLLNMVANAPFIKQSTLPITSPFNPAFDQAPAMSPTPTLNQQTIYNALTDNSGDVVKAYVGGLPISIAPPSSDAPSYPGSTVGSSTFNLLDNILNADALLGPNAYNPPPSKEVPEEETVALHFIRLVSGQADPLVVADIPSVMGAPVKIRNAYLAALRTYVATLTIGTSNLYQMLARRHITPGLGTQAQLRTPDTIDNDGNIQPGQPIKNASQLQVQNYIAQRRALSDAWYKKMDKAPPITVARETLYVLAEIQNSLNELRHTNERMLATLSVIELLEAKNQRPYVETLRNNLAGK